MNLAWWWKWMDERFWWSGFLFDVIISAEAAARSTATVEAAASVFMLCWLKSDTGSFWHLFPLRQGLPGEGPLKKSDSRHLMTQFQRQFAHNSNLLLLLGNQVQRHEALRLCSHLSCQPFWKKHVCGNNKLLFTAVRKYKKNVFWRFDEMYKTLMLKSLL